MNQIIIKDTRVNIRSVERLRALGYKVMAIIQEGPSDYSLPSKAPREWVYAGMTRSPKARIWVRHAK